MDRLTHLPGMQDLAQESWLPLKAAQDTLREYFSLHGYRTLETPLLEPTELFLRKSGGELAARMYTFTDPGGNQVSLRPEYTASIIRHYLEHGVEREPVTALPLRVQYAGPVFRYPEDTPGASDPHRQFVQVGAELLGSSSPRADAEVVALCSNGLARLGLGGHRLEVGDLGVMQGLMQSLGLSERATVFMLSSISELRRGPEGLEKTREWAARLHLTSSGPGLGSLGAAVSHLEEGQARELLEGLVRWADAGALGQREPSQMVERLLRKSRGRDDPHLLERAMAMASRLAEVRGDPEESLIEAEGLIHGWGLASRALARLGEIVALLNEGTLDGAQVVLDLGLVRGLAYYTGMVFEIAHPGYPASLGGGGRYDGLARALGSPSGIPALGFAYTLEPVLKLLPPAAEDVAQQDGGVLIVTTEAPAYGPALRLAQELREQSTTVELDVCGMGVPEAISYARERGFREVIEVGPEGRQVAHPALGTGRAT